MLNIFTWRKLVTLEWAVLKGGNLWHEQPINLYFIIALFLLRKNIPGIVLWVFGQKYVLHFLVCGLEKSELKAAEILCHVYCLFCPWIILLFALFVLILTLDCFVRVCKLEKPDPWFMVRFQVAWSALEIQPEGRPDVHDGQSKPRSVWGIHKAGLQAVSSPCRHTHQEDFLD